MNPPKSTLFEALNLSKDLLTVLSELEFKHMTEIQSQAIPYLLEGKDLVGQSETGSGKTAAFALPILEKISLEPRALQALILCPTRELCTQVAKQIRTLGRRHQNLHVLTITGGQKLYHQTFSLEKGVHIVVATPGRLVDHLSRASIDLSQIKTLVLDEADRMLDMGFEDDMKKIIAAAPEDRQTVLFSATMPKQLDSLIEKLLNSPIFIKINDESGDQPNSQGAKTPKIEQFFYLMPDDKKVSSLLSLLSEKQPESAIIFCNFKATVKQITQILCEEKVSAACLHGELEQRDRDREMEKFKNKSTRVLVATDVAARGIDVEDLDLVLNFEFPKQAETYVHRIGRTARAGKNGSAVTFVTPNEKSRIKGIEKLTGEKHELIERYESREYLDCYLPSKMKTIYISGGRKNKIRPTDILGALTGEAGRIQGNQVGKITIFDTYSYVAVECDVAKKALDGLRIGKIKARKFIIEFVD